MGLIGLISGLKEPDLGLSGLGGGRTYILGWAHLGYLEKTLAPSDFLFLHAKLEPSLLAKSIPT